MGVRCRAIRQRGRIRHPAKYVRAVDQLPSDAVHRTRGRVGRIARADLGALGVRATAARPALAAGHDDRPRAGPVLDGRLIFPEQHQHHDWLHPDHPRRGRAGRKGGAEVTIPEIGLVSTFAAMLALLITVGVMRMLPSRPQPVATSDQARYLMDQVLVERETARVLRVELDVTKAKVVALEIQVVERDKRISSLESQVSDLWSMVRGQAVAQASVHDATRPIQNGNRTKTATAAFSDDDVAFRDWLLRHFDADELIVLAANAGMDKPAPGPLTSMATALVQASRRIGDAETLQHEALEMRPNVEAW